jgi:hypothetical protein
MLGYLDDLDTGDHRFVGHWRSLDIEDLRDHNSQMKKSEVKRWEDASAHWLRIESKECYR